MRIQAHINRELGAPANFGRTQAFFDDVDAPDACIFLPPVGSAEGGASGNGVFKPLSITITAHRWVNIMSTGYITK